MKSMIVSLISLLIVIGAYWGFISYTHTELNSMMSQIDNTISGEILAEDWASAKIEFNKLEKQWDQHAHIFSLFLDTSAMLDTDFAIARARGYIEAAERSSALAELYGVSRQMRFLYQNELVNVDNIF